MSNEDAPPTRRVKVDLDELAEALDDASRGVQLHERALRWLREEDIEPLLD